MIYLFFIGILFSPQEIKLIEDAELVFREGLYEEAISLYNRALKTNLSKEMKNEILYRIGECYFNMGEYEKALKVFEDLESKTHKTYLYPEVLYALGVVHLALNHHDKAKFYLVEKIKEFPSYANDIRINEGQGIYYFTQTIYESSYEKLKNAISGVGIFYKALALARLKRPVEALREFKRVQMLYPLTPLAEYAAYESAEALFINNDFTGALSLYQKFIEQFGTSSLVDYAKYKIGVCYLHLGLPSQALTYFNALLGHPDEILVSHSYLMGGIALREMGDYEKSIKFLLKSAFDFPHVGSAPLAHIELGKTYILTGDQEGALIVFKQLSNTYVTGEFAGIGDYLAASILYKNKRTLEAQFQLENLIKYYPKSHIIFAAYVLLLKCMIDTRQTKEAILRGEEFLKREINSSYRATENDLSQSYREKWINRIKLMLAEAYYQEGDLQNAIKYYEELIESGDSDIMPEVFNGLGWSYLESERFESAIQKFDVVISSYQRDTFALISSIFGKAVAIYNSCAFIADQSQKEERFKNAAFTFKEVVRLYPYSELAPAALFYAGDAFAKANLYGNAVQEWEAVLSEYPATDYAGYAAYWLGDTYFRAGELDKAVSYFKILLEQYPENKFVKEGYLRLASTYYTMKDYDNARDIIKKFLYLFPEDTLVKDAKSLLEQVYYFKLEKEPERLEEFAKEFPESELLAQQLYREAVKLYNEKKYDEAIEKAKKVILLFPSSINAPEAQKVVVASYGALNNFKAMAEEAEKFVQYFPKHEEVPVMLKAEAQGLIQIEEYAKANEVLDRLISNYSSSPQAKEGIILKAEVLLNLGKLRESIKILEETSPTEEYATRYYYLLGEAYNKLGQPDRAINYYLSLLKFGDIDDPYRIRGLYTLANLYQLKGDNKSAAAIYEAIAQITTDQNIKNDALSRASILKGK
ncbi:MAG: tetratricopeptide repeat protein [Candidatus Hydrothermales bacterium]